jgi:CDP-diacylglycerol--serine O-phosphatidyltransferase
MRKILKNIPNVITSCNLLSGCVAVVMALRGEIETATCFIFAAAVFDFFDGFIARLLKAQSPLGLQLDSLADIVSFGVAPSAIIFYILSVSQLYIQIELHPFIPFAAFAIAVFSALRLAKFNIDDRQTSSFIGLPTPAAALFICGLVYFDIFTVTGYFFLLTLIPLISFLLICEIPMFSLKIKKVKTSFIKVFKLQLFTISCAIIFISVWQLKGISLTIALYIILSVLKTIKDRTDRHKKQNIYQTKH